MVKNIFKILISVILLSAVLSAFGCGNDFFGLIYSNDVDERLEYKDSFPFLDDEKREWRKSLTLDDNYKFLVVTDTHIEDGEDYKLGSALLKAVEEHKPKFVVNLGDITQSGTAHDISLFIDIADSLGVPFYPVIGNHDIYFGNWPVWRDLIGSTNYRIDHSNTTLLFLDSANAFFGKRQLDWLENEFKKTDENVFVFTHAPLFTTGIKMQQVTDSRERARIMSILKNKGDIMLMGHSHQRAENEAGNVQYVTFEDFRSTNIYCVVSVTSAKATYEFWKYENGVVKKL